MSCGVSPEIRQQPQMVQHFQTLGKGLSRMRSIDNSVLLSRTKEQWYEQPEEERVRVFHKPGPGANLP
jgi:hypothetical protein